MEQIADGAIGTTGQAPPRTGPEPDSDSTEPEPIPPSEGPTEPPHRIRISQDTRRVPVPLRSRRHFPQTLRRPRSLPATRGVNAHACSVARSAPRWTLAATLENRIGTDPRAGDRAHPPPIRPLKPGNPSEFSAGFYRGIRATDRLRPPLYSDVFVGEEA